MNKSSDCNEKYYQDDCLQVGSAGYHSDNYYDNDEPCIYCSQVARNIDSFTKEKTDDQ